MPKAAEILANRLRSEILGGGLEPGDVLPSEQELIETSQVGRSTVREALRLLESDGLISIKRGIKGGIFVRHPDWDELARSFAIYFSTSGAPVRDFYTLRSVIEPLAAAEAAKNATEEQRSHLRELAEHASTSSPLKEAPNFHNEIASLTNNVVLEIV